MLKFRSVITRTIFCTRPFPWLPRYTTAADGSNNVANYLVSSLDFSKDEAFNTCLKLTSFKSIEQPDSVIDFFRRGGFTQTQIKNMVLKWPKLLSCNVDKTLNPKTQALYDLGFSMSDVAHILSVCPYVFMKNLNDHIVPTIAALKKVFCVEGGGGNEVLMTVVKQCPMILSHDTSRSLPKAVFLLQSYGLTPSQIKRFALRRTMYLATGTDVLERVLVRADNLGIPRESPMFFHGIFAMCSITEANLELRKGVYRQYGFTDEDLQMLTRKNPRALVISEPRLRKCLEFFMNVAGFRASEIAHVPHVLMYSYEKRIRPRYNVLRCLKEKSKMERSLVSCLALTDVQFFKKYVVPFKDEFPDIYRDYVKQVRPVTRDGNGSGSGRVEPHPNPSPDFIHSTRIHHPSDLPSPESNPSVIHG